MPNVPLTHPLNGEYSVDFILKGEERPIFTKLFYVNYTKSEGYIRSDISPEEAVAWLTYGRTQGWTIYMGWDSAETFHVKSAFRKAEPGDMFRVISRGDDISMWEVIERDIRRTDPRAWILQVGSDEWREAHHR